jgi:hypothetical protein
VIGEALYDAINSTTEKSVNGFHLNFDYTQSSRPVS